MANWEKLFEWRLQQQLNKKVRLNAPQQAFLRRRVDEIRTDLDRLSMAYKRDGKLDLADAQPKGFLLKYRG